jgi:hypothetical protein
MPKPKSPPLIGWREHVRLPRLHVGPIVAKIDTGAKSAALHAEDIKLGRGRVRFVVVERGKRIHHEAALVAKRRVKSSSGHVETRAVIETTVSIGRVSFDIEVTLTDRADMGVPMLLGRSSLGGSFAVHPARSFILSGKSK